MYRVYGYDDMCIHFELNFDSFVEAVKAYRKLVPCNVTFLSR